MLIGYAAKFTFYCEYKHFNFVISSKQPEEMFILGQGLDQAIDCVSLTLNPCKKMRKQCYRQTDRAEFIGPSTLRKGQGSIRKHPRTQSFPQTFNIVTIRYNCIRIHNINPVIPAYNGLILNPPNQIRDIIVMLRVGTSYNTYGTLF